VDPLKEGTREAYEERILLAQMYVWKHLDESIRLEDLAREVSFSPYHFHRLFAGLTGESVGEYIRRLRLERGALELRYGPKGLSDVAQEAGYETQEAFTKAFRGHFGVPPGAYRQGARSSRDLLSRLRSPFRPSEGGVIVNVTVKTFEPMEVVFVRHTGPYAGCAVAWEKLCSSPRLRATFGPDTRFLGICYDDPDVTEADKIRFDACATVPAGFVPEEGLAVQSIAGGDYAVYIHRGPFSELHDAYQRIYGQWLPGSGREVQFAPSLEVYLDDPQTTPPEKCRTEIRIPLK
jgi:AraC family transcriptional regulator